MNPAVAALFGFDSLLGFAEWLASLDEPSRSAVISLLSGGDA
jgi:hypothetical protein